jgi:truncated hemoglobin YjbI
MPTFDAITDPAIVALVDRFYTKARFDPDIGPLFNSAVQNWDEHLQKLYDFWSSVMLTTGRYKGNPMAAHVNIRSNRTFSTAGCCCGAKRRANCSRQHRLRNSVPGRSASPRA